MKSFSVLALLTLPVSAFCVIFAPELVDLLLGDKWHTAVVPFAILSGTLYFSLAWRNCATLFQALGHPYWITAAHICRAAALIAGIWWVAPSWTYSNLRSDRRRHGLDAWDHAHHRQVRDRSSTPTRRCGALPSPRRHRSYKWPLSDVEGATAGVAWPRPCASHASACSFLHLASSSFSTRSASSARAEFWRSTGRISEEDETHPSHRHTIRPARPRLQQYLVCEFAPCRDVGIHYATPDSASGERRR